MCKLFTYKGHPRSVCANNLHNSDKNLSSSLSGLRDPVTLRQLASLELVIESPPADAENRRGLFFISRRRGEGHSDKFLFCGFEGHSDMDRKACQKGFPVGFSSVSDSRREKLGRQFFSLCNEHGSLDHILKLSHVARPLITFKEAERLSRKRPDVSVIHRIKLSQEVMSENRKSAGSFA